MDCGTRTISSSGTFCKTPVRAAAVDDRSSVPQPLKGDYPRTNVLGYLGQQDETAVPGIGRSCGEQAGVLGQRARCLLALYLSATSLTAIGLHEALRAHQSRKTRMLPGGESR